MNLEQELRAALVVCEPGPASMAAVMAKLSSPRRNLRPIIVVGSMVAVAAAAAMLASRVTDGPLVRPVTTMPSQPGLNSSVVSDESVASPMIEAMLQPALPEPVAAVKPFKVSVQLENRAKGVAVAAVELFYSALLDKLHLVPGLTLIELAPDAALSASEGEYRLLVAEDGPRADMKFGISVAIDPMETPDAGRVSRSTIGASGYISDPVGLAETIMELLRSKVLPPDPTYNQRLKASLLDSKQDPALRLKALMDLGSIGRNPAGDGAVWLDAAAIRGVIDLVARTTDPVQRAQIWRTLRGVHNADLVPALVASLRTDSSIDVRLEAMTTLNADFSTDARARAVLESMARDEPRLLLRALAQRAISGEVPWKQYILASLQDPARPIAERVEAFSYHAYGAIPGESSRLRPGDGNILNDDLIQALSQVLPQAANDPSMSLLTYNTSYHLLATGKPAGVRLVLSTAKQATTPDTRSMLVSLLGRSIDNASVRSTLQTVNASDPDAQLRQIAAEVLRSGDLQPLAADP